MSTVIKGSASGQINLNDTTGSIQLSGSDVLTIDSSGNVTIPNNLTVTGSVSGSSGLGNKNLIINGDMRIAQRATSKAGITAVGYYTVDRFQTNLANIGTWTQSQSAEVPSGEGFATSLKMDCTTADASPAVNDYLLVQHKIEGQNLQHLKKGTSNAEKITLSFWVRCNQTGNLQVNLRDIDNSRMIASTYTINTADTWEKKTITFDGDTTGTLDNDNASSLQLEWWLDSGTDFSSGSVPTAWETTNSADRNAGGTINLADSTSNDWYITGIQLEIGDTATPFEHRPYDMELTRCQRYYYKSYGQNDGAVPVTSSGWLGSRHAIAYSVADLGCDVRYPVPMRTSPTVTIYHQDGTSAAVYEIITGTKKAVGSILYGNDSGFWHLNSSSLFTTNYHYYFQITASAEL